MHKQQSQSPPVIKIKRYKVLAWMIVVFLTTTTAFAQVNRLRRRRLLCPAGTVRVTRCIGSGAVMPNQSPRCTTSCEGGAPARGGSWGCSGNDREGYVCTALVPSSGPPRQSPY